MTNPKPTTKQVQAALPSANIFHLAEFQMLVGLHLNAVQSFAQRHGHSVKSMGFVITTDDIKQTIGGFHGCTCLACSANVMALMETTVGTAADHVSAETTTGQVH